MLVKLSKFFHLTYPTNKIKYFTNSQMVELWWLNTVLAVCECMPFAKSWQEGGCSSQVETWQVKNILMKDFD